MFLPIRALSLAIGLVVCGCSLGEDIEKLLKDNEIIPDVLLETPKELLKVEYANGLLVGNGEEFTPTQTKDIPQLQWSAEPDAYYTVIMTNADPPSRAEPKWREWLHWLVVNVPGSTVDQGDLMAEYIGPAPPKDHGLLRYVFFVYKQSEKVPFDGPIVNTSSVVGHENFSSMKFAAEHGMDSVPVAVNFFQAQFDDWVPNIHKQLNIHF